MDRPRASRPALTVTSGGRGVGSDEACSVKVLVDENGTVSGGVDAQISVTASVDASGGCCSALSGGQEAEGR